MKQKKDKKVLERVSALFRFKRKQEEAWNELMDELQKIDIGIKSKPKK